MGNGNVKYQETNNPMFESSQEAKKYFGYSWATPLKNNWLSEENDLFELIFNYHKSKKKQGIIDKITLILATGQDPNVQNKQGWTPLHYAAMLNVPEIYKILLKYNADDTAITNKAINDYVMKDTNSVRDIAVFFAATDVLELIDDQC